MLKQSVLLPQQLKTSERRFARAPLKISVPCQTPSTFQVEGKMKELLLDLVTSYNNRISTVEELITTAYRATASSDNGLAELDRERERLRISLQETLTKNCSLRRKDFNILMEKMLSDSEGKRREVEDEQKQVKENLREYLNEQRELAAHLRKQLLEFAQDKGDNDGLSSIISQFKTACQDKGGQVFALLRNLQSHLETLSREQEGINHQLQRLVNRGESLRVEDLRQLQAARTRQDRKATRELRRQEVERLLYHFKQQRQGTKERR
jgi:regulator of replication initiation timing